MRDKLNNLFRAAHEYSDPLSEEGNRNKKRPADVLEHNLKDPIMISFRIITDVGLVQDYVRMAKKKENPSPLDFNYIPESINVEGPSTEYTEEFVTKFNAASPRFKVILDNYDSIVNYRNPESISICRIHEIRIINDSIDDLVIHTPRTSGSKPVLSSDREKITFRIYAILSPEQTLGRRVNFM